MLLTLALLACLGERIWHGEIASMKLSGAIHNSADLAARSTAYWHVHGAWPPPGEMTNRGYEPAGSITHTNGTRIDRYHGIGGPIEIHLMPDGTLRVQRVAEDGP